MRRNIGPLIIVFGIPADRLLILLQQIKRPELLKVQRAGWESGSLASKTLDIEISIKTIQALKKFIRLSGFFSDRSVL